MCIVKQSVCFVTINKCFVNEARYSIFAQLKCRIFFIFKILFSIKFSADDCKATS